MVRLLSDWGLADWGLVIPQISVNKSAKFRKNPQNSAQIHNIPQKIRKIPQIDWGSADWGLVIPKKIRKIPQNSIKPSEH